MTTARTWALLAGGGTAGHVLPGLAIGHALVAKGRPASSIHFVGSRRGIETRLVPEAGFGFTSLTGRGIERKMTLANLTALGGLARAFVVSLALMARRRPAVVVSLGGYAAVPCAFAAVILRVPLVVVEQNAVPGATNRLLARFARASAVSFEDTPLPRAHVTGNPLRQEVVDVNSSDREASRRLLGLDGNRRVVAVFGGSLGARRINLAVVSALRQWAGRNDLAVRHVVGERDWDLVSSSVPPLGDDGVLYQPVRYEDRMPTVLAAADLAVCRAGATSVAELAAVGLPSILIPLPGAPGDHQTANARTLADAGAAASALARPGAAAAVAALIEECAAG